MISGRGLGITGGTLDKLESIPGFNTHLGERRARAQLESIGVFMIEQTEDICPAEKKLFSLREVTGTIPSPPLIVASIMSKKLAENLDRLVLDVKFGSGGLTRTRKEAKHLAASMTKVGKQMGVTVSHLLSPMDEPLGRTVGNALEVAECVEVLQGGGPSDVVNLVLDLAEQVSTAPRAKIAHWLSDGTAWRKFISLVYAQDGDASSLEKIMEVRRAPIMHPLFPKSAGIVKKMDAQQIGRAALLLGGGRQTADDNIDYAVGLSRIKKVGERVEAKEPLLFVHARTDQAVASVLPHLRQAVEIDQ
jgi:pyrimidine-nucleoside phosphorylase